MPAGGHDHPAEIPTWAALAQLLVHYDTPALKAASQSSGAERPLATLFAYLTIAHSSGETLTITQGQEASKRLPECFLIYDDMSNNGDLGSCNMASEGALASMSATLRPRIIEMSDLPRSLQKSLRSSPSGGLFAKLFGSDDENNARSQARLIHDVIQSGEDDRGEPSYAVLGRIFQDTTFSQVHRRANFIRNWWGLPTDDYVAEAMPLVEEHPYAGFIRIYNFRWDQQREKYEEAVKDLNVVDAAVKMQPLLNANNTIETPGKVQGQRAWDLAYKHMGDTAWDAEQCFDVTGNQYREQKTAWAHRWHEVSPDCPMAMAALIEWDYPKVESKAKEWEEKYGYHPSIVRMLGWRYFMLKHYDDAERCLRKYIKLSPDLWGYEELAAVYWDRGDKDRWLQTLKDYLEQPCYGLEHEQVQVKIARYYMNNNEWHQAIPYAEQAAETYASAGLRCAGDAYEGAGDFEEAEKWVQRNAERYDNDAGEWLLWCVRTGHGNVKAARGLAGQRLERISRSQNWEQREEAGVLYLLMDQKDKALEQFKTSYEKSGFYQRSGLRAVLVANEKHDNATRDQLLATIIEKNVLKQDNKNWEAPMLELARIMQKTVKEKKGSLDSATVDQWYRSLPENDRTNLAYLVGQFALQQGDEKLGRRYLLKSANGEKSQWSSIMARDTLRKRGVTVPTQPEATTDRGSHTVATKPS